MGGADDRLDGSDDFGTADTAVFPAAVVRRVRVLLGMVPLPDLTADEVAAVFRDRIDAAG